MDAGSRSLTFSHSLPHRTTPQTPGHKCLGRSLRITVPRGFKNTYKNSLFLNAAVKLEEEKVDMAGKRGRAEFLAAPEMSFSRGDFRVLCLCGSRVRARRRARGGCVGACARFTFSLPVFSRCTGAGTMHFFTSLFISLCLVCAIVMWSQVVPAPRHLFLRPSRLRDTSAVPLLPWAGVL
jgi:hypothetical protein